MENYEIGAMIILLVVIGKVNQPNNSNIIILVGNNYPLISKLRLEAYREVKSKVDREVR